MYRPSNDAGYTLLELLISVAIIAMITVPISGGIHLGLNQWRLATLRANTIERDMLVRSRLQAWLAHAYPFDVNRRLDVRLYPLSGTDHSLTFVAPTAPDPRSDILQRISLNLDDGQIGATFVPDPASYDSDTQVSSTTLLKGVASWSLAYLDATTNPAAPVWVNNWSAQFGLPAAIRIRVIFKDGQRIWPDLVAPLKVREWAHCAFDEVSRSCRTGADAG